ncbi:MAG: nucleotidyltransferase domain-containing protein [Candidatus Nezhaarchaeota archaeon]|nr:nucleotidyltransferase domain-containing protein [Candidatus Nezhaarchaeota archaeon]
MSSPPEDLISAVQAWRLRTLLGWRQHLPLLAEAVREALREAEVYVFGSALEKRLTVDSDVDVLVVVDQLPRRGVERAQIVDKIWRALEARGVSYWYPSRYT